MERGKRKVESGKWKVERGKWKVEKSSKFKVESGAIIRINSDLYLRKFASG